MTPHRQSGVALITCMMVFAIAAALVTQMVFSSRAKLQKTQWLTDEAQAREDALLAEQIALLTMTQAKNNGSVDQLLHTPSHNATINQRPDKKITTTFSHSEWQVHDLQGRINLNNLINDGALARQAQRFLQQQGIDQRLIDSIRDWIDIDTARDGIGAEDTFYEERYPPHLTANQLLTETEAVYGLPGFNEKQFHPLQPLLSALPEATPLNINSAPKAVLSAIHPGLDASAVFHARQQLTGGFSSVESFIETQLPPGTDIEHQTLTTTSTHYLIDITTRYRNPSAELQLRLQTLVRFHDEKPRVIHRRFGNNLPRQTTGRKSA